MSADRMIVLGVSLALAAAFAQIVAQVIDVAVFDLRIAALNSDSHRSVFGVLSLVAQAASAVAVGARCLSRPRRVGWWVLGSLIAVLLLGRAVFSDEAAAFALPVALAFVLFWWLTSTGYHRARTVVRVGLFVLAFSFVVHIVGPRIVSHFGYGYGSWPYELKGISKHSTELAGWILVGTGVLAGWRADRRRIGDSGHSGHPSQVARGSLASLKAAAVRAPGGQRLSSDRTRGRAEA